MKPGSPSQIVDTFSRRFVGFGTGSDGGGDPTPGAFDYLRNDGTSYYFRPDGTSYFVRP